MATTSDVAELSSLRTQLEDLRRRVAAMADAYRDRADVTAATDLFNAERLLLAATRSVERAARALEKLPR